MNSEGIDAVPPSTLTSVQRTDQQQRRGGDYI
jgi:hypothetical protein